MARCGGCRRCGWHLKAYTRGRLRGLIVVQHGCVPRGRRLYKTQRLANDAAKKQAAKVGAWVLAGVNNR